MCERCLSALQPEAISGVAAKLQVHLMKVGPWMGLHLQCGQHVRVPSLVAFHAAVSEHS